jgi:uncharacterized protein with HEPN domain
MLSDAATAALLDMEHHIALAAQFVHNLYYETFRGDTRTVYAVTRALKSFQKRPAVFRLS